MSIQHFGKGALRVAKNYTKGYSDVQAKVRDATSNDAWGPSGTQMNEIAQMTYNQNDFVEIMEVLDKRLNDKGKNWRHVFKSLTVLDYCLHAGSENVVIYFRDNLYLVKTLKEFQYTDEEGKDHGANVRQKARDITNLLSDDARLREERRSRAHMRDRMTSRTSEASDDHDANENERRRSRPRPPRNNTDDDLQKAIEESKRTARADIVTSEERDLQEAIRLSEELEEKRKKEVRDSGDLFDPTNPPSASENSLISFDASTQPQFTGLQPQFTALQPQSTALQPQLTAFNPWQQQAEQQAMQAQWAQQQNDWNRQQQEAQQFAQQQLAQQQLALQQEEWLRQQQQQQLLLQQQQMQQQQQTFSQPYLQPLAAQPTGFGSNNPFAPSQPASSPSPASFSPSSQSPTPVFNLPGTFENRTNGTTPSPRPSPAPQATSLPRVNPQKGPTRADLIHPELSAVVGNQDDGVDTFGNYGKLRYGGNTNTNPFSKPSQTSGTSEQPFFAI